MNEYNTCAMSEGLGESVDLIVGLGHIKSLFVFTIEVENVVNLAPFV